MYWQDLYQRLQISEIQYFLLNGQPPVVLQLLVVNSIFMIFIIMRRMRTEKNKTVGIGMTLQWILLFTNLVVVCQQNVTPYLHSLNRYF